MFSSESASVMAASRSPYGERGLKFLLLGDDAENAAGRSPYGERGLKSEDALLTAFDGESLSLRRAWIEISCIPRRIRAVPSLSLRRAWIEIDEDKPDDSKTGVALLTESVD